MLNEDNETELLSQLDGLKLRVAELEEESRIHEKSAEQWDTVNAALRKSEQMFRKYFELGSIGMITSTLEKNWLQVNDRVCEILGYTREEMLQMTWAEMTYPGDLEADVAQFDRIVAGESNGYSMDKRFIRKNGEIIHANISVTCVRNEDGSIERFLAFVNDISDRKQQEEQINRSLKMDALGKLTSGIAHDYNNMLCVIIGYTKLMEKKVEEDSTLTNYLERVYHAAERGAALTEKLLSFSRNRDSDEESVDINMLLMNEKDMLEKTLTARINVDYDLADDLSLTWLDSNDMEDVIINLSINAMHAIDGHGQLTIQTRNVLLDDSLAKSLQLDVGEYVLLNVIDTGCGMNEATKAKMFDPFYSTKGEKGTGLGLSQVYGFVQGSGGAIKVYSELGHGTQLSMYFPSYKDDSSVNISVEKEASINLQGTETIMVVDDEPALRSLASEILKTHGYKVFSAEDGMQALEFLENESIDLLFSDVIMPKMDGYKLADCVHEKYPSIKIQLTSGFTDERHLNHINARLQQNLLSKPYDDKSMLLKIRKLLG